MTGFSLLILAGNYGKPIRILDSKKSPASHGRIKALFYRQRRGLALISGHQIMKRDGANSLE